ncbi:MAG: hypothetical protein HQL31_12780, partial [Planctomycetes bacterium]|nr:hypothetical protein [Planctomycetota bacterium]
MNGQDAKGAVAFIVLFGALLLMTQGEPVAFHPWQSFALYALAFAALYRFTFFAPNKRPRFMRSTAFILVTGIVLRCLFLPYPVSDDVNRYAWEGHIQQLGINPYTTPPSELEELSAADPVYSGINHKEVSAIYPPVAMLTFRAISATVYSLQAYKVFFLGAEVLVLLLLIPLIRQWRQPAHYLALYAWNPLILLYGSGESHFDVLHLLFITASLVMYTRGRNRSLDQSVMFLL